MDISERPIQLKNRDEFIALIDRGHFDDYLAKIANAVTGRQAAIRNEVIKCVKEVFGEEAAQELIHRRLEGSS